VLLYIPVDIAQINPDYDYFVYVYNNVSKKWDQKETDAKNLSLGFVQGSTSSFSLYTVMQVSKPAKCGTGCIIGAVVGSVVGALLLVVGTVFTYKKCQEGDPDLGTGRSEASHGGSV